MKLGHKISQATPFLLRHLMARQFKPYEQVLRYVREREDIWIASQGEYMSWWQKRANATLKVTVCEGKCQVDTSLENGVIEKFPGEFLDTPVIPCEQTTFSGDVWITLDSALEKKELLIELLKREGIFNFRVSDQGEFILSKQDVGSLLAEIVANQGRATEENVRTLRQLVINKLAAHNLPLLRVWYHPRLAGVIVRAVFSPRFDVDRAITNVAHIRAMEKKYNAPSTLYLRVFCPFYADNAIKELAGSSWCSEIALHGEFITHAQIYSDEFKAAAAEKAYLENLTGRPILGVGMHGGEMSYNKSENTDEAIQKAGFLYDTTRGTSDYYFPYKRIINGCISDFYTFPHAMFDVSLFPFNFTKNVVNGKVVKSHSLSNTLSQVNMSSFRDHGRMFFENVTAKMNEVYEGNGIFIIGLHPGYFGFISYLTNRRNWLPLIKYGLNYFKLPH